jgi:hypothetical protein
MVEVEEEGLLLDHPLCYHHHSKNSHQLLFCFYSTTVDGLTMMMIPSCHHDVRTTMTSHLPPLDYYDVVSRRMMKYLHPLLLHILLVLSQYDYYYCYVVTVAMLSLLYHRTVVDY